MDRETVETDEFGDNKCAVPSALRVATPVPAGNMLITPLTDELETDCHASPNQATRVPSFLRATMTLLLVTIVVIFLNFDVTALESAPNADVPQVLTVPVVVSPAQACFVVYNILYFSDPVGGATLPLEVESTSFKLPSFSKAKSELSFVKYARTFGVAVNCCDS